MFYLYGTSHCHLCEEAEAILQLIKSRKSIAWEMIDIAYDDYLMELYGLKIPVLKAQATNNELCWPFALASAETFTDSNMY